MSADREWTVTVRDADGRRKSLTVLASEGKVVLVGPSGERSELAPLDVGRLRAALRDAVVASETPVDAPSPVPRVP